MTLREYLIQNPTATDAEIAAASAPVVTYHAAPLADLQGRLIALDLWLTLVDKAGEGNRAARNAMALFTGQIQNLHMEDEQYRAATVKTLNDLTTLGIPQPAIDALASLWTGQEFPLGQQYTEAEVAAERAAVALDATRTAKRTAIDALSRSFDAWREGGQARFNAAQNARIAALDAAASADEAAAVVVPTLADAVTEAME